MDKYLKHISLFIVFYSLLFSIVFAQGATAVDTGLEATADCAYGTVSDGKCSGASRPDIASQGVSISSVAGKIVGAALSFVGVLFFILMIYGGFLWMTAAGNEQQVEKAKNLIIAAIIGLIVIMSAYAITAYVGATLTSR